MAVICVREPLLVVGLDVRKAHFVIGGLRGGCNNYSLVFGMSGKGKKVQTL